LAATSEAAIGALTRYAAVFALFGELRLFTHWRW